jgi:hypothetical protein
MTARPDTEAERHAAHGKWLEVASGEPLQMRTQCGDSVGTREPGGSQAALDRQLKPALPGGSFLKSGFRRKS